ncbi:hypothetical protein HN865_01990 [Candidatus Woesearchaeota archaeon]|jgi:uncharacterized repeat protein (TIGR01451 family)|nr:hypothetical protein [Candidatus Woesearchaeota archaeon]
MNRKLSIIGMLLILIFSAGATIGLTETEYDAIPGETIDGQFDFTNDLGRDLTNITFRMTLDGIDEQYVTFNPANGFDEIIIDEIKDINFNLEIPQTTSAGMHNGEWFVYENGYEILGQEESFTVNVSEKYALSAGDTRNVDLIPGESTTFTVIVTNDGNMPLNDLVISQISTNFLDHGNNQVEISFSATEFNIPVGAQEEIIVTVTTQSSQYLYPDNDHDYEGLITIGNTETSTNFNLQIDMAMEAFNHITIENLEDLEELAPGEEFDIEIEFDDAKFDIEDVEVELTIYDFDEGDNFDTDSERFDVDENDDYDLEFNLEVPLDVDDAKYDVLLDINGDSDDDDYNNFRYYIYYENAIDVEKDEKYDVGFNFANLEPETPMCGGSFTLKTEVINTGRDKINDMYLKLKINELDISKTSEEFDLKETENKRDEKVEFFVNLPTGMEDREYTIEIIAYDDDNDIIGSEIVTFTPYGSCAQVEDEQEELDISNDPDEESTEGTVFLPTGWSVGDFLGSENAKTSFWVIGDLALVVIIIYFVSLFFKKKK